MRIATIIILSLAVGMVILNIGIMLGEKAYEEERYVQELERRLNELEQQAANQVWEPPKIEVKPVWEPIKAPQFNTQPFPPPAKIESNYKPKLIDTNQSWRDRELLQIRQSLNRIADALD